MDISLLSALLGGVLTLLSPCSVMLLPAFFSYAFTTPAALLSRTAVFYLGLITTLVPLGVLAGTLGAFVNQNRFVFITVAAAVVILLGILMLLNIPLPLMRRSRTQAGGDDGTTLVSVYTLGTVYGLAGVCAGPLLGSVLTLAAIGGNAVYGGLVLLIFAAGMTLPLFTLALLWGRLPWIRRLVRPREIRIGRWRNTITGAIGGALTIAIGTLLLATNGTTTLSGALGATDQARVEGWVLETTSTVPDSAILAAAGIAAIAAWALTRRASRRRTDTAAHTVAFVNRA